MSKTVRQILLAGFLSVVLSGCGGYRLGPTSGVVAGEESIEIKPFRNSTYEPRLNDAVTTALRRRIQQDGTYRLETRGGSDIVVEGSIVDYRRSELAFRPEDTLTVRDYNLTIYAHIIAKRRDSDEVILDQRVQGWTMIRVENDLASAERQAMPNLAEDLARNISYLIVDGMW